MTRRGKPVALSLAAIALSAAAALAVAAAQRDSAAVAPAPPPPSQESPSLADFHARYVETFVASPGFGPERISPMRRLMSGSSVRIDGTVLRTADLRLIGIAKHDPPVTYAADYDGPAHPGSRQASGANGIPRELTGWEREALVRLAAGEPVVASIGERGALCAAGPIRARTECLGCHRAKREGDLLGALVYDLRPANDGPSAALGGRC